MRYDDEMLERALGALALEESPPDLRARILAATVNRPAPIFNLWELWTVGFALAVASWLVLAITGNPLAGGPATAQTIAQFTDRLTNQLGEALAPVWLMWFAIGGSAALWLSLSLPGRGGEGTGTQA